MERHQFEPEHDAFRKHVQRFIVSEVLPHVERWRGAMIIDRDHLRAAARAGLLGLTISERFGGRGKDDYRFNQVILEEYEAAGVGPCATGLMLQNDIIAPYLQAFGNVEQQQRWLRPLASAQLMGCLAITEEGTGSDVAGVSTIAVRDGAGYRVNGGKKFIGCGINADFALTVVRTDPEQRHHGLSLLVLEKSMPGYEQVENIPRVGRLEQDIAELAFRDVWVPAENLIGEEGAAFGYLMHNLVKERMQVAVSAIAACRYMFEMTVRRAQDRVAFGRPIGTNQHLKFQIAEMSTELAVTQAYIDQCVRALNAGTLTAVEAAQAKWWGADLQVRFADRCFEVHGATGYMGDSPMSRAWRDARITTIYAGSNEIMKEIVGRSYGF
jgi:alkylation response protein AidB-like acyl-CoA dehydrogenase